MSDQIENLTEENLEKKPVGKVKPNLTPYFILGGFIVLAAIFMSLGFWYQTSILDSRLSKIESIQSDLYNIFTVDPNDALSLFKATPSEDVVLSESAMFLGNPEAPIVMILYEDFQCPFCKSFNDNAFNSIKKDYIDTGKVKFIHQNFSFLGDESILAAEASKCAQDQNKFWEYREILYNNQSVENSGFITIDSLKEYSNELSLDLASFSSCLDSHKYKDIVLDEESLARLENGVSATPTFFVNGKRIEGAISYSDFKKILDYELGETSN